MRISRKCLDTNGNLANSINGLSVFFSSLTPEKGGADGKNDKIYASISFDSNPFNENNDIYNERMIFFALFDF